MRLEDELKTTAFKSAKHKAMLNVIFTGVWLSERTNRFLKQFDLSEQQFNVLRILRGQKGQPINMIDIQERMVHKMSNATRLVEKLRQKGLVQRVICENNRRKVEITITTDGLQLLADIDTKMASRPSPMDQLTDDEANELSRLLERLRDV